MAKNTENGCRQIEDFLLDCAHALDDDELESWPDFFTEDAVYQITKVIWENLSTLQEIHGATKDMRLDIAIEGLGAPLHRGAIRYYREVGLTIPQRLILESDWAEGELEALPFATDARGAAAIARGKQTGGTL